MAKGFSQLAPTWNTDGDGNQSPGAWRLPRAALAKLRGWSLMRNSLFIMGTTVATSGLGYVYWLVAARAFSAYEVGMASTLISAMILISSLSNLGLGATLVHILPRTSSGADWSASLTAALLAVATLGALSFVFVVVALPLALPWAARLFWSLTLPLGAALALGIIFTSIGTVLDQAFVAERASSNMLFRNIAFSGAKLALIAVPLLLVFTRAFAHNALFIVFSWVGGLALSVLFAVVALIPRLRREYRPTLTGAFTRLRSMRKLLVGNHFINIGSMAPMYLLPVFVTLRLSVTQSAYFYTTWMLAGVVFMITPSIASSLFAEGSHHPERVGRQAMTSLKVGSALLIPAIALFVVFGRTFLSLFGHAYAAQGATLLIILVVAGIPDGATNVYISVLRVRKRVFSAGALNVGMAACTLVGAWILLPVMGLVGAGAAWLIAQCLGVVVCALDLLRLEYGWSLNGHPRTALARGAASRAPGARQARHARSAAGGRAFPAARHIPARATARANGWYAPAPRRGATIVVGAHAVVVSALVGWLLVGPHLTLVNLRAATPHAPTAHIAARTSVTIQAWRLISSGQSSATTPHSAPMRLYPPSRTVTLSPTLASAPVGAAAPATTPTTTSTATPGRGTKKHGGSGGAAPAPAPVG